MGLVIYVASSWRTLKHVAVVHELRSDGHIVYDYRDSGFNWGDVAPNWKEWNAQEYLDGLQSTQAVRGFARDMGGLEACDVLVYLQPSGRSAGIEFGFACGAGIPTIAVVDGITEPDLMLAMADHIVASWEEAREILAHWGE